MNEKQTPVQALRPTKKQKELLGFVEVFIMPQEEFFIYQFIFKEFLIISLSVILHKCSFWK